MLTDLSLLDTWAAFLLALVYFLLLSSIEALSDFLFLAPPPPVVLLFISFELTAK
jgi:hypothetical protein